MDRAFAVEPLSSVDLSQPAATAQQYLAQVRYEASQLPEVLGNLSAEEPSKDLAQKAPGDEEEGEYITSWQNEQLGVFVTLRQHVARLRVTTKPDPGHKKIADADEQGWMTYCLGGSSGHAEDGNMPRLSEVCHFGQQTLIRLLRYHTAWLQTHVTRNRGLWIYALLTCLDKLQTASTIASLRDLARACVELKAKATKGSPESVAIQLLVTIIAYYFQQLDFADHLKP